MAGIVVTFYSYKGGVGRTAALANVAAALARDGRKVIAVDMDLESPGLHTFFRAAEDGPRFTSEDFVNRDGVLDFVEAAAELPVEEPHIADLLVPAYADGISIRLLTSGRLDDTYASRVARFSWDELYRYREGHALMDVLRRQLVELADIILIDSRTGTTDVAGICTIQLPDVVVLVFALHQQGIEGVAWLAQQLRGRGEGHRVPRILLVPSRVEEGETDRREEWLTLARQRLGGQGELLDELDDRFAYESRMAFGEQIIIFGEQSQLSRAYERLARRLIGEQQEVAQPPTSWEELDELVPRVEAAAEKVLSRLEALRSWCGDVAQISTLAREVREAHTGLVLLLRAAQRHIEQHLAGLGGMPPVTWGALSSETLLGLGGELKIFVARAKTIWQFDQAVRRILVEFNLSAEDPSVQSAMSEVVVQQSSTGLELTLGNLRRKLESLSLVHLLKSGEIDEASVEARLPVAEDRRRWLAQWLERWVEGSEPVQALDNRAVALLVRMAAALDPQPDALTDAYLRLAAGPTTSEVITATQAFWSHRWAQAIRDNTDRDLPVDLIALEALGRAVQASREFRSSVVARCLEFLHQLEVLAADAMVLRRYHDPVVRIAVLESENPRWTGQLWMARAGAAPNAAPDDALAGALVQALSAQGYIAEAYEFARATAMVGGSVELAVAALRPLLRPMLEARAAESIDQCCATPAIVQLLDDRTRFSLAAGWYVPARSTAAITARRSFSSGKLHLPDDARRWLEVLDHEPASALIDPTHVNAAHGAFDEARARFHPPARWKRTSEWNAAVQEFWNRQYMAMYDGTRRRGEMARELTQLSAKRWMEELADTYQSSSSDKYQSPYPDAMDRLITEFDQIRAALLELNGDRPEDHTTLEDVLEWSRLSRAAAVAADGLNNKNDGHWEGELSQLPDAPAAFWRTGPVIRRDKILEDVPRFAAGELTVFSAFRSYLEQGNVGFAVTCIELLAEDDRDAARQLLRQYLDREQRDLREAAERMLERLRNLRKIRQEDFLDDSHRELAAATDALEAHGSPMIAIEQLARLRRALSEADVAAILVEEDLRQRDAEKRHQFDDSVKNIGVLLGRAALHERLMPLLTRLVESVNTARNALDLDRLRQLTDLLKGFVDYGNIDDLRAALVAPSPRDPLTSALGVSALSALTRQLMEGLGREDREPDPPVVTRSATPGLDWSTASLQQERDRANRRLRGRADGDMVALQVLLLAEAKLALVTEDYFRSQALFGDLLRCVTSGAESSQEAERLQLTAARGFLLAFLFRHGASELAVPDWSYAFAQPRDAFSLVEYSRLDLWEALGYDVAYLGGNAAAELVRTFLGPALNDNALVVEDFVFGLFSTGRWAEDLSPLRDVFTAVMVAFGTTVTLVELETDLEMLQRLTESVPVTDRSRLAVEAAREGMMQPQRALAASADVRLLTRRVHRTGTRVVLEVVVGRGREMLRSVRPLVRVMARDGKVTKGTKVEPPVLDRVSMEEQREFSVVVPDGFGEAEAIEVRLNQGSPDGIWRDLPAPNRRFLLQTSDSDLADRPSPFVPGLPLLRPTRVFGRDAILHRMTEELTGANQHNVVLLLGERRIGKTTLLRLLERQVPKHWSTVIHDLQDAPSGSVLLERIRLALIDKVPFLNDLGVPVGADPWDAFRRFLRRADEEFARREKHALVILDEFDKVFRGVSEGTIEREAIACLRAAAMECRVIAFVWAGETRFLLPHLSGPEHRLFQSAVVHELEEIAEPEAKKLIETGLGPIAEVLPRALVEAVRACGGQPFLLQRLGHHLFERVKQQRLTTVTATDVLRVIDEELVGDEMLVRHIEVAFRDRPEDQAILEALAVLDPGRHRLRMGSRARFIAVEEIARRCSLEVPETRGRLDELTAMMPSVLGKSRTGYHLKVGLIARHIRYRLRA